MEDELLRSLRKDSIAINEDTRYRCKVFEARETGDRLYIVSLSPIRTYVLIFPKVSSLHFFFVNEPDIILMT